MFAKIFDRIVIPFTTVWIITVGMVAAPQAGTSNELVVGFMEVPPLSFTDANGRTCGVNIDYFKILANRMELDEVQFKKLPFSRLLHALEDGEIDVVLTIGKNPEREKKFVYPGKSFATYYSGLAVQITSPIEDVNSISDIDGFRIGVVQNGYVDPMLKDKTIKLKSLSGDMPIARNILMVGAGRIDAFYLPNTTVLEYEIAKQNMKDEVKVVRMNFSGSDNYSVFSKNQSGLALKYEAAIDQNDNIILKELLDKYLGESCPKVIRGVDGG